MASVLVLALTGILSITADCVLAARDDPFVVVGFLPDTYVASEADGMVTLSIVKRTHTTKEISLQMVTQDKSATSSTDYTAVIRDVVFEPDEVVKEVNITILQDSVAERLELFTVSLVPMESTDMIRIEGDGVAKVVIEDDDRVVVQFVRSGYTVSEGDGEVQVCLRLEGQVADQVILRLTASPVTAEAGLDYDPGILNFVNFQPPGDSVVCTTFEIIDDLVAMEEEEMFVIDVTGVEGQITIAEMCRATVTIQDNDVLVVGPSRDGFTVSEGDCDIELCFIKNMDTAGAITVNIFIVELPFEGNAATAGADFVAANTTILFSPTENEVCTEVEIIDDDVPNEPPEQFILDITVNPQTNVPVPPVPVTILDNDVADAKVCVVTQTLTIFPFNSNSAFYQFEGLCDHYLLQLCDSVDELSVTADFSSTTLSSARVGLRYRDSSVVSSETGQVILNDLTLVATRGNIEVYNNGFVVVRENGVNRITLQLEGNITVIHTYGGNERSIRVLVTEGLSFGGTDVPTPVSVCGLCGDTDGTLLQTDLLTTADITNREQIQTFIDSYAVVAAEQFLRGQTRECSVVMNDTVIGDPVFTVPVKGGSVLCYDVRGEPGTFLNLISDKCTSVNADYEAMDTPENGNIMKAIGIRAVGTGGACHNVGVRMDKTIVTTTLDGSVVSGRFEMDGVKVRTYSDRVRVSVPNCELVDLIMWVVREVTETQAMLRFQVSRGYNLSPTSHGLIGQFWNVPVSIKPFTGSINEDYGDSVRDRLYLVTIHRGNNSRTFVGEYSKTSWDRSGPCYYGGDAEGGRSGISDYYGSVIEGKYTDYKVAELFSTDFVYNQFEENKCT